MDQYIIAASSTPADLVPVVMAVHHLLNRLPVTARSRDQPGIRIEEGRVVDDRYTGPVLEAAIAENAVKKEVPVSGPYRRVPVVVAPVRDRSCAAIGAIGVGGIPGIVRPATLMDHSLAPCPIEM